MNKKNIYGKMWSDFGKSKADMYLTYKFDPTWRSGLTNYLREKEIIEFLSPQKEDVVLDAGCASGRQLFKLFDKIKEGYGTDISEEFIDKANFVKEKNEIKNLYFQTAILEKLPFQDNYFTKIICAEVLEHVFDKDVALKELIRVLKPGGELIITVPNFNADGTIWGRLLRAMMIREFKSFEHFSMAELKKHGDAHVREFNKKTLSQWLKDNNLKIKKIRFVSYIDGPCFDFLLKFPLHVSPAQKLIIWLEKLFTSTKFPLGRQLIVKSFKK